MPFWHLFFSIDYNCFMESIQSYIYKYIIFKIESDDWKPGFLIPSENKLAQKFECSRITARNALQKLVNSGVLISIKGKGYEVNSNTKSHYLSSWSKEHNINRTELEVVKNLDSEIIERFGIKKERLISFVKRYYDENNKMIAVQLTVMNKNIIWESNYDGFKESITNELVRQGIMVQRNEYNFKFEKTPKHLEKYFKELGYIDIPLVEQITSSSDLGWIEKTLRITNIHDFNVSSTRVKFT